TIRRQPRGPDAAGPRGDVAVGALHDRRPPAARRWPRRGPHLVPALPPSGGGATEHGAPSQLGDPDRGRAWPTRPRRVDLDLGGLLPRGLVDREAGRARSPDAAGPGLREPRGRGGL